MLSVSLPSCYGFECASTSYQTPPPTVSPGQYLCQPHRVKGYFLFGLLSQCRFSVLTPALTCSYVNFDPTRVKPLRAGFDRKSCPELVASEVVTKPFKNSFKKSIEIHLKLIARQFVVFYTNKTRERTTEHRVDKTLQCNARCDCMRGF